MTSPADSPVAHPPRAPRAALIEVTAATAALFVATAALEWIAGVWPAIAGLGGAALTALMLLAPHRLAERAGLDLGALGLGRRTLARGLVYGLVASVVVLVPFAGAHDLFATAMQGRARVLDVQRLRSPGEAWQGEPQARPTGLVVLSDVTTGLAVANGTTASVLVARDGVAPIAIPPGSRGLLPYAPDSSALHVGLSDLGGQALPEGVVRTGAALVPIDGPAPYVAERGFGWMALYLLVQWLGVALPEEFVFRGYVLARLDAALPARRRLLGAPFGLADVLTAALFALLHLASNPSPARLLVFFPALLFAWVRRRSGTLAAPIVLHGLSNAALRLLGRLYG